MTTTRDKVLARLRISPDAAFSVIAVELGVTRQRVHQIAVQAGYLPSRQKRYAAMSRPEYQCWKNMISRCSGSGSASWKYYGARGIRVCDRWRSNFDAFLSDMGQRPSHKHSIDRINNDGHYEPLNCRWATVSEQRANRRDCGARAGMRSAKERGATFGPKPKFGKSEVARAIKMLKAGKTVPEVAKHFKIARQLVYPKVLKATGGKKLWQPKSKKR